MLKQKGTPRTSKIDSRGTLMLCQMFPWNTTHLVQQRQSPAIGKESATCQGSEDVRDILPRQLKKAAFFHVSIDKISVVLFSFVLYKLGASAEPPS